MDGHLVAAIEAGNRTLVIFRTSQEGNHCTRPKTAPSCLLRLVGRRSSGHGQACHQRHGGDAILFQKKALSDPRFLCSARAQTSEIKGMGSLTKIAVL